MMKYEVYGDIGEVHVNMDVKAKTKELARSEAIVKLAEAGFVLVNDEALVFEIERVYETRWDCMPAPERVRQVA